MFNWTVLLSVGLMIKKIKPLLNIPIEDLVGRSYLLPIEEDGTRSRATIIKVYEDHKKDFGE